MCGIFGIVCKNSDSLNNIDIESLLAELYKLSYARGNDSSGIAILDSEKFKVYKRPVSAKLLIKDKKYKALLQNMSYPFTLMGHARMETNGTFTKDENNQPVVNDGIVTIHNGIIVNDDLLWKQNPELKRKYEVDTEVLNALLGSELNKAKSIKSITNVLNKFKGAFSISSMVNNLDLLLLATNTGTLYIVSDQAQGLWLFSSESYFLKIILKKFKLFNKQVELKKVEPSTGLIIDLKNYRTQSFNLKNIKNKNLNLDCSPREIEIIKNNDKKELSPIIKSNNDNFKKTADSLINEYEKNKKRISQLQRCKKCILPVTMPFIEFDADGICNYCQGYKKVYQQDRSKELQELLTKFRKTDGTPDCIVSFSGGRDSSYALHYLKKEMGMNPIAYSYDWGMLTDLGRRNQAIMTGELGVEHILISADIQKKRRNIKQNVEAWLKNPNLGTVPLFMAGDKQYFYYATQVKKNYGLDLLVMGENYFEQTSFKNGFAGIAQDPKGFMAYHVPFANKLKMLFFYFKEFAQNPAYLNSSIFDSFTAFNSYFIQDHKYLNLFNYIPWVEKEINKILMSYGWETAKDTPTTWRIGDGTVSFYNFIYYTVAGFTENDTFRSNQIREGMISRNEALGIVEKDNKVRPDSILWYLNTIGVDMVKTVNTIKKITKLY